MASAPAACLQAGALGASSVLVELREALVLDAGAHWVEAIRELQSRVARQTGTSNHVVPGGEVGRFSLLRSEGKVIGVSMLPLRQVWPHHGLSHQFGNFGFSTSWKGKKKKNVGQKKKKR